MNISINLSLLYCSSGPCFLLNKKGEYVFITMVIDSKSRRPGRGFMVKPAGIGFDRLNIL
jgi:hypothetical protein